MRRPLLLLMTIVLGIASIAAALASASLSPGAISNASPDTDDGEVVLRYYAAINHMIASGDPAPLREVVDQEMIDLHAPPSGTDGRTGIEQHLEFLHAAMPDARIEPASISDDGAHIVAEVAVRRNLSFTMLGFAMDERQPLWPTFEVFQVSRGQIQERRASWNDLITLAPVDDIPYDLGIPDHRELAARINYYAPRVAGKYVTADAPEVLRLLSGELDVSLSESATDPAFIVYPTGGGGPGERRTVLPGHTSSVAPQAVVVIPPGSAFTVTNESSSTAALLRVSISIPYASESDAESFTQPLQAAITVQTLISLQPHQVGTPAQLSFGTVVLMPGSRLIADPAARLMIVCSESGELRCVSYEPGSEHDGMVRVHPFVDDVNFANPLLLLAREAGGEVLLNAGDEPAAAWIVAVTA